LNEKNSLALLDKPFDCFELIGPEDRSGIPGEFAKQTERYGFQCASHHMPGFQDLDTRRTEQFEKLLFSVVECPIDKISIDSFGLSISHLNLGPARSHARTA